MRSDHEVVTVGQIQRPFGVKGEVKVRPLSDVPARLETLSEVNLVAKDGKTWQTRVTEVRRAGAAFIVKFAGLTTPEAAKLWCGGLVQTVRMFVPPLAGGYYYESDLIGLTVRSDRGQRVGVLEEVWELPAHHVFVVRDGERETLIPAVRDWVTQVDLERKLMTVHLLDAEPAVDSKF